jgi:hypothetical protein
MVGNGLATKEAEMLEMLKLTDKPGKLCGEHAWPINRMFTSFGGRQFGSSMAIRVNTVTGGMTRSKSD